MQDDTDDGGRFPDGTPVLTPYPTTDTEAGGDRASWPWLPACILAQAGPDEWSVIIEAHAAARVEDGTGIALFPVVSRDSSEIRLPDPDVAELRAVFFPADGGTP